MVVPIPSDSSKAKAFNMQQMEMALWHKRKHNVAPAVVMGLRTATEAVGLVLNKIASTSLKTHLAISAHMKTISFRLGTTWVLSLCRNKICLQSCSRHLAQRCLWWPKVLQTINLSAKWIFQNKMSSSQCLWIQRPLLFRRTWNEIVVCALCKTSHRSSKAEMFRIPSEHKCFYF